MRHSLFYLTMLLAVCGSIHAQTQISGTLRKENTEQAVAYGNIVLLRATDSTFVRGTTSDDRGRFTLKADTTSTLLRISAIGFETLWLPVNDSSNATEINLGILQMKEGATTLDAVNITARKPIYSIDGEKKIYNVSEDPTIQNGTAQDALQSAPGVQVDGDGNITLNGKEVKVYINDRESHYTDDMLKQYIKTLTADQISSIEAIEYPSAKYGGKGPVINIRTQQNLVRNSYLSFGAYGSSSPALSPFVSYAYANEKLRFNAYVRYSREGYENETDGGGNYYNEDSVMVREYNYKSTTTSREHNANASLSFSYDFDTMNTLSTFFNLYPSWSSNVNDGRTVRRELIGTTMEDYSYNSHSDYDNSNFWGYGGLNFQHKFNNEGHALSFSAFGSGGGTLGSPTSTSWNHYDVQPQMSFDEKESNNFSYHNLDMSLDYSWPYSNNGELEAGIGFSMKNNPSSNHRDTLGTDGLYHCDALRSDSIDNPEYDSRIYLSWRRKLGNFTLRIGGNLYYDISSASHIHQPEYDTTVGFLYFSPSITLLYNTESMHSFSLDYSSSITPPTADQLNRYETYGTDSYSTGNPNLGSSYTHDLGFSYDKYFEQGHSIGINTSFMWYTNVAEEISLPDYSSFFGRYVMTSRPFNAKDSRRITLSAYGRWRPSALFSMSLSGTIKNDWYRTMVHTDEWMEDEKTSFDIRLNTRVKVFNLIWLSATGYYSSQSHGWSAFQISEPRWGAEFSASADLFDRKLSFYLNVYDIFHSYSWNSSSINPYAPSSRNSSFNSQSITFGITLRFGKMELGDSSKEGIVSSGQQGGK